MIPPALLVMLNVPLGLDTSPAILTPSLPVLVIVVSLSIPKFLTLLPASKFVPLLDVIIILPLLLAKPFAIFILSALTRD